MAYTPEKYVEVETPKPGTMEKTVIKLVEEGTIGQFVKDFDKYNKEGNSSPEDPAILVTCENGANKMFTLPKEGKVSKRSNLGRFKSTYGSYPKEGLEVNTIADEGGFFNIVMN